MSALAEDRVGDMTLAPLQPEDALLDASRRENLAHAFRAIDVGREEVTEHWYDQLFLISHDVAFTEVTDQMIRIGE